ncbi:MAG: DEAD/DEAH box helicase [Flavobacteriales bacterium]|nr:DEAD/DEAH box helicase [Flavobacteriales bacterium]
MTFNELGLKDSILSAIGDLGYEKPTPIQQEAIPFLIENQGDLVGLASTGTGKTAAFGLPLLNQTDETDRITQGLVICPTRELCIQIANDLENYSKNIKGLDIIAVYGGSDIQKQIRKLDKGAQIVVATPGRLVDLIKRKKVRLRNVDAVVLDEADEMLNMGFKEDIDFILDETPVHKSVWLFSATMPKAVSQIAKNYMESPFEITVGQKNEGNKNIEHHYYVVKERDRFAALKAIIDYHPSMYGLIFCRTRRDTAEVADKLMANGYNAEPLHGDLSQAQRDRVMEKFRQRTLQILVATDVAARGIDVDDITHVIHHKLPEDVENYTHRSGRTARAGRKGVSLAIINTKEGRKIKTIERIIKTKFQSKDVPTVNDICEKQVVNTVDKLTTVEVDEKAIEKHMDVALEKLESYTKEDLIKRIVASEFNRFKKFYEKEGNLNARLSDKGGDDFGRGRRGSSNSNAQRFFVNLGKKDGFNQGALLRIVCDSSGINKSLVGKIDIMNNFSFFDADKSYTDAIIKSMQNVNFEGKVLNVEKTNSSSGGRKGGRRSNESRGKGRRNSSRRNQKSKRRY